MSANSSCSVCGSTKKLLRCSRCKSKFYCSREHQKKDWKEHRKECAKLALTLEKNSMPAEGSSESDILNSLPQELSPHLDFDKTSTEKVLKSAKTAMPISGENIVHPKNSGVKDSDISLQHSSWSNVFEQRKDLDEICQNLVQDMDAYGVCVVDNFLGEEKGKAVLGEVLGMYNTKGVFKDGQLVSRKGSGDLKTIRGDRITWINGTEKYCNNIKQLISQVDAVVVRANKMAMASSGKLGMYNIDSRTKVSLEGSSLNHFRVCLIGSGRK